MKHIAAVKFLKLSTKSDVAFTTRSRLDDSPGVKRVLDQIPWSYLDDFEHPSLIPIRTRTRAMRSDRIAAKERVKTYGAECTKVGRLTSVTRASVTSTRRARIGLRANLIWRSGGFIFMFIFNLMSERAESLEMDLGYAHSCALLLTGKVMCWGYNGDGQLGDGTYTNFATPVEVPGISTATSIGLGGYHSCALLMSGKVMCWGYNQHGQLGDGTPNPEQLVPVEVSGISTATSISVGFDHSCVILADGKVMCWGYNYAGGLGVGTTTDSAIPVQVSANFTPTSIALGKGHACALLNGGKVMCWGSNGSGQLGDGTTTQHLTPVEVSGITSATRLSLGDYHSCAVLVDGKVMCWGYNGDGQLGDGTYADRTGPVEVLRISTATSISLGGYHSCAVLADGKVMCWGLNGVGTLGDGTATINRTTPTDVLGISTATTIARKLGRSHSCAVLTGHRVICWGSNSKGQLGDGSTIDDIPRYAPVDVDGLRYPLPSCRWLCTSIKNDCCAPGDEEATCSGNYVPIYTGDTCWGYDGDYRCCNPGVVEGVCNSTKCTSLFNDCCAPGDETATCSDGYAPIYTGLGCAGFDDGDYMCCITPEAKSNSDSDYMWFIVPGVVFLFVIILLSSDRGQLRFFKESRLRGPDGQVAIKADSTKGYNAISIPGCIRNRSMWLYACFPIVLLLQSITTYFIPCVGIYLNRLATVGEKCLCCICVFFGCWHFKDSEFFGADALGDLEGYVADDIEWVRAKEVCRNLEPGKNPKLFAGKIEPADLRRQGVLGNCWLLAALAALAEHPVVIRKCFLNREYNSRGKYRVSLYDGLQRRWVIIVIDDYIPVKAGTKEPIFVWPNGEELWAMLLEKAFAKFYGSYAGLDGGQMIGALFQMTGDHCFAFMVENNGYWKRYDAFFDNQREIEWYIDKDDDTIEDDRFFSIMLQYNHKHSVITAAIDDGDEALIDEFGLVNQHAYAVLEVRRAGTTLGMGGVRLIKLRNPHGDGEWTGRWSDGSEEWYNNPAIAREVGYVNDKNDGTFWMEFSEFKSFFNNVQVCDRTTAEDIWLDVEEDSAICGPVIGCIGGCTSFWCCCMGVRTIYCGNVTKERTENPAFCCTTV